MSFLVYVQIEAIPLVALLITLILSKTGINQNSANSKRFHVLVILIMSILLVDGFSWYSIDNADSFSHATLWITNIIYFLLTEVISYFWFLYVFHQTHEGALSKRAKTGLRLSVIPLIIICVIIMLSPLTKMIFYIDPDTNTYYRGAFHFLQEACGFGYMLCASAFALVQSRHVPLAEQKNEYRFLCFIVLLPLIGGILQLLNYNCIFLWPFTAAATFLIHVDYQRHHISVDALTSLNNRGTLERYIQQKTRSRDSGWYLVMMDIDRFKQINDIYGHMEGDRALRIVAQALKNVFGKTDAFFARYGGDEFVVISDFASTEALDDAFDRCHREIRNQLDEKGLNYTIRISYGFSRFENNTDTPSEKLFQSADAKMYQAKKEYYHK